jgi:heme-degrading monooxygenase HmoA
MQQLLVLYRFVVEDRQQEFEEQYRSLKTTLEGLPGHFFERLVRSTTDPTSYVVISIWQPAAFLAWLQSPSHDAMVSFLNAYKRGEASIARYRVQEIFDHSSLVSNLSL